MLRTQKLLFTSKYSRRVLYRHSSGMGTVICFNDGMNREVLVLDAKYRTLANLSSNETILPEHGSTLNINGNAYLDGVNDGENNELKYRLHVSDKKLNYLWQNIIDANTSKYNTDVLIDSPAAIHCRSIKVGGVGCDIPNIQILMRIYCEANRLDALDPTVSQYSTYAFGDMNSNGWWRPGGTNDFWSSTKISKNTYFQIRYNRKCVNQYEEYEYGVCPVLEL